MFEIFLGSSLSRSTFNLIMKVTLISFAPNFMLVTTSKVCADGSRPFPSDIFDKIFDLHVIVTLTMSRCVGADVECDVKNTLPSPVLPSYLCDF
jgi:hypothetical protein